MPWAFDVGVDANGNTLTDARVPQPMPGTTTPWVPRPSRFLRRVGGKAGIRYSKLLE
jgi:hypothetical protein